MSRKSPTKVRKTGAYEIRGDDASREMTVVGKKLQPPTNLYSATWLNVVGDNGSILLCFGQRLDGVLFSRVDVRIPLSFAISCLKTSEDFIDRLISEGPGASEDEWAVTEPVPRGDKYIVEDATFVHMAYSAQQAEMEFYRVPSLDIHNALQNAQDVDYRGPRPVLTVCCTRRQLTWLLGRLAETAQGMTNPHSER